MRLPKEFYILVLGLLLLALVLGLLVSKTNGSQLTSIGEKSCQMDAEARNLKWEYRQVGGCYVLTKSGAWIPLTQFDHPSQIP